MDKLESLMAEYPMLKYKFKPLPFKHLGGYIMGNEVTINGNNNYYQQYQWLQEELAHYDNTVGDIVDQSSVDNRRQELQAQRIATSRAIPLNDLIVCYKLGMTSPEEVAEFFDVTIDYLWKSIENYRVTKGDWFTYHGYTFDLTHGIQIFG